MSQTESVPRSAGFYPPPPLPTPLRKIPIWAVTCAIVLVLVAVVAATLGGVSLYRKGSQSALATVAPLHNLMVQGNDAEIFSESDPLYQKQVGREKSDRLFGFVRDKLGAPRSAHVTGFNVATQSKTGETLTLTFTTTFDKGEGLETIQWRKVDGTYRLLGYDVKSNKIPPSSVPADLRSAHRR